MFSRALIFGEGECSRPPALEHELRSCVREVLRAESGAHLLELADRFLPCCFLVLHSVEVNAELLRLLQQVRQIDRGCQIVLFAQHISMATAVEAMRTGASDLLEKHASPAAIRHALHSVALRSAGSTPGSTGAVEAACSNAMVGYGPSMTLVRDQIFKAASSDANVLLTGESGTGKEIAAQLIHQNSRRSHRKFVALNCAAIPEALLESELFGHERGAFTGATTNYEGKFQHAAEGTLFLDEIGDMPLSAQAKILRVLENRVIQRLGSNVETKIQVRIVAATNQNLERLTLEKKFRQDLYFRLNVARIAMPPLRERREDIPVLVEHLLHELGKGQREQVRHIESDVIRRFQQHDWPGNVRELRNAVESILVFSSSRRIGLSDLPEHVRESLHSRLPRYADERSEILAALSSSQWNRNQAAEVLHCSRMTLYRKMVKYAIPADGN